MNTWESYSHPLDFLLGAINDTQETIRFIDTKAAFLVTLVSAMTVVVFQTSGIHPTVVHPMLARVFLLSIAFTVVICLQVIFPVLKPQTAKVVGEKGLPLPKFYVGHHKSHHWLRHTFSNSVEDVLSETLESYTESIAAATERDLMTSLCDELLMVSLIRQIKADRLHTATFALGLTIVCFLALML